MQGFNPVDATHCSFFAITTIVTATTVATTGATTITVATSTTVAIATTTAIVSTTHLLQIIMYFVYSFIRIIRCYSN